MKNILVILLILCCSCNMKSGKTDCIINEQSQTFNYKKEIEKFSSLETDTIIELDSGTYKHSSFRTVLDQSPSERTLWLIIKRDGEKGQDSILLFHDDNVEYLVKTYSEFDLTRCEVEQITEYNLTEKSDIKNTISLK